MKIVKLEAEAFKRLVAVEIEPGGKSVTLAGRNAQGKSSVLDAIWATLGGKRGSVEQPIHNGETKARVVLTLDDMVVTRKWTHTGSTLTITSRDGKSAFSSPQKMLDKLVGDLSFDPLAFAEAKPADQRAMLIDVAELDFDPDANASSRKALYDERTEVNRDAKRLAGELAGLAEQFDDHTPEVEPDVQGLSARLITIKEARAARDNLAAEWRRLSVERDHLMARLDEINTRGVEIRAEAAEAKAVIDSDDETSLVAALENAQATSRAVSARQRHDALSTEHRTLADHSDSLTREIQRLDQEKSDGLAAAKLPVNGLSFDDDGVLYNGIPFSQSSAAERLMVSTAMAMAMNPGLRVILIRDASLLDDENLAIIQRAAEREDFQLWVETVHPSGDGPTVVIEDGSVQA